MQFHQTKPMLMSPKITSFYFKEYYAGTQLKDY